MLEICYARSYFIALAGHLAETCRKSKITFINLNPSYGARINNAELPMAKYKPIDMVKEYHGKICEHSDTYFQKRGRTLCTGRICEPRDLEKKPYKEQEIAVHNKFSQVVAAIKALTPEEKAAYKTAFDNQSKYTSLRGYMFAKEYEKLGA